MYIPSPEILSLFVLRNNGKYTHGGFLKEVHPCNAYRKAIKKKKRNQYSSIKD